MPEITHQIYNIKLLEIFLQKLVKLFGLNTFSKKITGPISMFPEDVINSAEIKKYYGAYNALGKSLTIYELWYKT